MTGSAVDAAVAACVQSHISWMLAQAELAPHPGWTDGPVRWAWSADGQTLQALFPEETPAEVIRRGIEAAEACGAAEVVVWSPADIVRPELERIGFEVGWPPHWMTSPTAATDPDHSRRSERVALTGQARHYEQHLQPLLRRGDTWLAEASQDGKHAGRGWLHLTGPTAGLYDMAVWARFRRGGLGRDLITLLRTVAREHGARQLTLNATPEGEALYEVCNFTRVGVGRTWWYHLSASADRTE